MASAKENIIIIGAGPAGLTTAYELSKHKDRYRIIILEQSEQIGGISKTVNFRGNLIDLGGHRFFSKHDTILDWWANILPVSDDNPVNTITYHNKTKKLPENLKKVHNHESFLIRPRKSRIYYNHHFFNYPLQLKIDLLLGLGLYKSLLITLGILRSKAFPIKPEKNLEDFYINRFGRELYDTFFKDYTRKVWGKECTEISSEWGRQRVKSLSIRRIIWHSLRNGIYKPKKYSTKTERSLTEYFLYPAKGPGQLWETVAKRCTEQEVELQMNCRVTAIETANKKVEALRYSNAEGEEIRIEADRVITTMPVRHLMKSIEGDSIPKKAAKAAAELEYRDFIIVGLLVNKLAITDKGGKEITDNWLYIQDKGVNLGRLQIFHNWSPYMTVDKDHCWIGAEYFCNENDALWERNEKDMLELAVQEVAKIGIIDANDFIDGIVVKCPKAYPSYTGSYKNFNHVIDYLKTVEGLYPIGRNGMHKYNNQDHSMLTAFKTVELITTGKGSKQEVWEINTEEDYHEEKVLKKTRKNKLSFNLNKKDKAEEKEAKKDKELSQVND